MENTNENHEKVISEIESDLQRAELLFRLHEAEKVLLSLKFLDTKAYDYIKKYRPSELPNLTASKTARIYKQSSEAKKQKHD